MNKYEEMANTMRTQLDDLKKLYHTYDDISEDVGIYTNLDKSAKRLLGDTILAIEAALAIITRLKTESDEETYDDILRPLTNLSNRQLEQYELLKEAYELRARRREKELQGYKKELTMEDIRRSKRYF